MFSVREEEKNVHFWILVLNQPLFLKEHCLVLQKDSVPFDKGN